MATYEKRGNKWRARVRHNGRDISKSFLRKSDAQEWVRDLDFNPFQAENITLHSLIEKYIAEVSIHHRGEKQEALRLRRIVAAFPDIPIVELRKDQFSDWKNDLLNSRKPGTVRRYMTALNSVFNHAMHEWGYIDKNPIQGIKKPPDAPHRERYPKPGEIEKILQALKYSDDTLIKTKQHEIAVSLLLALETAMRASEILSINKNNTDLKRRVVYLADTKNSDAREVPLSKVAIELIKKLPGRAFTVSSAVHSRLFSDAVKAAGIDNLTFHDSRAGGLMRLSKKVDVLTLARIVGHRDPRSLMIYYREEATNIAKLLD